MSQPVILASSSEIRRSLLENAGLRITVEPARVDEDAIRQTLTHEGYAPRDLADALAEAKAARVSSRHPDALVIASDQILELDGDVLTKASDRDAAASKLRALSGKRHELHAAAVIHEAGKPVWRHISSAKLTMHDLGDAFINRYLERNWDTVRHSVGCYRIEDEGPRLFSRIDGSHFAILGLPLIELLTYLRTRGILTT